MDERSGVEAEQGGFACGEVAEGSKVRLAAAGDSVHVGCEVGIARCVVQWWEREGGEGGDGCESNEEYDGEKGSDKLCWLVDRRPTHSLYPIPR